MRDTHATGIGSIMGAGTAGYCVGNLQLEGTPLPGEDPSFPYPESLASPLQVDDSSACPLQLLLFLCFASVVTPVHRLHVDSCTFFKTPVGSSTKVSI